MHTPLEPHVAVAGGARSDQLTVHSSTQTPSFVRTEIARLLGWPENRVRVKTAFLGGGFGAKVYVKIEALAVALALLVRRPVRLALTMEEQFFTISKHASTFRIKSAVTEDGRIKARRCEVFYNGGAYADIGPRVAQKSGFSAAGPTTSRTCRSIPLRSTPTGRRPAHCAASACRNSSGPMRATPT